MPAKDKGDARACWANKERKGRKRKKERKGSDSEWSEGAESEFHYVNASDAISPR